MKASFDLPGQCLLYDHVIFISFAQNRYLLPIRSKYIHTPTNGGLFTLNLPLHTRFSPGGHSLGTHDPFYPPGRCQLLPYPTSLGEQPGEQLAEAEDSARDFHSSGSAEESGICGAAGD